MMKLICAKLADSVVCMLGIATLTTNRSKIVMKPPESSTARPRGPGVAGRAGVSGQGEGRVTQDMSRPREWDRRYSVACSSLIQFSCLCYY